MGTKVGIHLLLLASALFFFVTPQSGCGKSGRDGITLAGSTAFQPFAEKLAERYLAAHPDESIDVQGGGSAVGIQAAISGAAEIGVADMLQLPQEAAALTATVVARDGIALVVHPSNPLRELTAEQAHDIFAGRIRNWRDLGGRDATIHVFSREDGSGTRKSFDKMVLRGDRVSGEALYQNSNGTIREAVASDPNAIGYVSIGLVNDKVKALLWNGTEPTNQNVVDGIYPLARPVYFLTRGEPAPPARRFIEYVLSAEGQQILAAEGLVPVN
ncbi:MAG: phosphate ABC transporter substrate-binding protein [Candidatus Eisenbacteria bacterium]|nr:phosphate ABC transporter substrate-binding protein [Candidatus Eisenbacteria bacterium]